MEGGIMAPMTEGLPAGERTERDRPPYNKVAHQRNMQRRAGAEAHQRGTPLDAGRDADWRDGWRYAAGRRAFLRGLPMDDRAHPQWREGWEQSAHHQSEYLRAEGHPERRNMDQEDRQAQRRAGVEAQQRGLPCPADADAEWREGWHLSAGADAYINGLPYDDEAHPLWRAGWKFTEGAEAHTDGLPYDDRRHPDWQDGWQSSVADAPAPAGSF